MIFSRLTELAVWALAPVKWEPWLTPKRLLNRNTSPGVLRKDFPDAEAFFVDNAIKKNFTDLLKALDKAKNPDGVAMKPKHAPRRVKMKDGQVEGWYAKGGTTSTELDGTVWYTDWEGNSVPYINGFPDFARGKMADGSSMVRRQVDIDMKGNQTDFTTANKESGSAKLEANTWHHHENGTTMQEIDYDIHSRFTHAGGVAKIKRSQ